MEIASNIAGATTSGEELHSFRSKHHESSSKNSENFNPNVSHHNPVVHSPQNRIRQRKFLVAKKNPNKKKSDAGSTVSCKCRDKGSGNGKCLCVAYENLRASQEEFFKNREEKGDEDESVLEEEVMEASLMIQDLRIDDGCEGKKEEEEDDDDDGSEVALSESNQMGSSTVKRRRDRVLEEARNSVPESGSGRVMHLVKAFEKLRSIPNSKEEKQHQENEKKVMKWALPGLQPLAAPETEVSGSSSFCPSELILTSQNLGLDPRVSVSSSWDSSSRGSCSVSSRNSSGGRRSRRNSLESSGTFGGMRWKKKQLKVTSQKPFKLRTEQRGKLKEEEFMKKIQEMMTEEEKQRIPIAQGLPWTTDEPECLLKRPVKESTRPIDLKLHSDVRAIDRAEFDHQVAEKMSLIEQYKLERERQQKLAEEEEIRRLRKELIPKAQPMPYFDRPFVPRRSMKHPTIPRDPKFHIPHHKKIKCCLSWNDMSPYSSYLN